MQAKALDPFGAALVSALCVIWGFNQVVVKLALPEVGPIAQTGIRSGVGAICVVAYALASHRRIFTLDGTEAAGALAGALFTAEFIALYESLRFTTAARATVFIYAAPFVVALGAAFLLKDERLRPIQWAGLLFAFLGVACGFLGRTQGGGSDRRRAGAAGRGPVGRDDDRHQGDVAQARRPAQGAALSDRVRHARRAVGGLRAWRGGAHASDRDVDRLAHVAGRNRGRRQLHAVVLDSHPLRRSAAIGVHLHNPPRRGGRGLARAGRNNHRRLRAGDCACSGGPCARQLAAGPARARLRRPPRQAACRGALRDPE